jgi:tetratricopeptide (TPR) repeat protein
MLSESCKGVYRNLLFACHETALTQSRCYDELGMGRKGIRTLSAVLILALFLVNRGASGQRTQSADPIKEIFEQGRSALVAGRYADAERDFERLVAMGQRSAPIYTNLGVAYLRTGKLDDAIRLLNEAKKLAPSVPGIDLNLGLAYYRQHEFKQAVSFFASVLAADSGNAQARYLKGVCHFMMDDFENAVGELAVLRDSGQQDLEYLFMLGVSYGKLKRTADAEQSFGQLVRAGGDTPHLHELLGKAYLALNDYPNAQTELEKAAGDSQLPYSHYYLGVLYEKLGKFDAAAIEFEKETKISPNDTWPYESLTRIKLDQGKTDDAISLLEVAVTRVPDAASLQSALGKAYSQKGGVAQAIPHFERALALEPQNGNYHYQLGRAYLAAGRQKEGMAEIATARTLQKEVLQGQMEALSREGTPAPLANAAR